LADLITLVFQGFLEPKHIRMPGMQQIQKTRTAMLPLLFAIARKVAAHIKRTNFQD